MLQGGGWGGGGREEETPQMKIQGDQLPTGDADDATRLKGQPSSQG